MRIKPPPGPLETRSAGTHALLAALCLPSGCLNDSVPDGAGACPMDEPMLPAGSGSVFGQHSSLASSSSSSSLSPPDACEPCGDGEAAVPLIRREKAVELVGRALAAGLGVRQDQVARQTPCSPLDPSLFFWHTEYDSL